MGDATTTCVATDASSSVCLTHAGDALFLTNILLLILCSLLLVDFLRRLFAPHYL